MFFVIQGDKADHPFPGFLVDSFERSIILSQLHELIIVIVSESNSIVPSGQVVSGSDRI